MPSTPEPTDDGQLAVRLVDDVRGAADGQPAPDVAEQFGPGGWRFTRDVAQVFDDHVRASVPFYDAIQRQIAECSDWLVPNGGLVADLGCATGNTSVAIAERCKGREIRFELYDESEAMLAQARPAVAQYAGVRVQAHVRRLPGPLGHAGADLTVIAFTLQFLPVEDRRAVLLAARDAAAAQGALIVAEKTRVRDSRWAEIGNDVSHDYKAAAGVSDAAIRAKASSLRGVLRPLPASDTGKLISSAGWTPPQLLFAWHQWALFGAFAEP